MIDHTSVGVSDYQKGKEFYSKALAPLRYKLAMDFAEYNAAGFGADGGPDFWIGKSDKAGNVHVAFAAKNKEEVEAFYKAGLEAGGADNGAPGYRTQYSPDYYAAFVHDPDGNNIEAVWHDPNPA